MGIKEKIDEVVTYATTILPVVSMAKETLPGILEMVGSVRDEVAKGRAMRQVGLADFVRRMVEAKAPEDVIVEAVKREYGNSRASEVAATIANILQMCMVANMRHANGEDADEGKE